MKAADRYSCPTFVLLCLFMCHIKTFKQISEPIQPMLDSFNEKPHNIWFSRMSMPIHFGFSMAFK